MKSLRLSARELAYLTGLLGADEFYGLEDPFFGLDRSEISAAVRKAQEDLDARGLLEMNFVGGASVSQAAADVVSVCARCDSYAVCLLRTRKGDEKRVLYRLGGRFVTLARTGRACDLRSPRSQTKCSAGSRAICRPAAPIRAREPSLSPAWT